MVLPFVESHLRMAEFYRSEVYFFSFTVHHLKNTYILEEERTGQNITPVIQCPSLKKYIHIRGGENRSEHYSCHSMSITLKKTYILEEERNALNSP
jgi:hypothetical protein